MSTYPASVTEIPNPAMAPPPIRLRTEREAAPSADTERDRLQPDGEPDHDPDAGDPDAGDPDAGDPDTTDPDTTDPDTTDPDTGDPDAGEPEPDLEPPSTGLASGSIH
jgi:hypothetical protein